MDRGKKIYENIQRLAYANGMTIGELCRKASVSAGSIGDLKHGRRDNIGTTTIQKLCAVLKCSPSEITTMAENPNPMPEKPQPDILGNFYAEAVAQMEERKELRRLVRVAMRATPVQVNATAVLLEEIISGTLTSERIKDEDSESD